MDIRALVEEAVNAHADLTAAYWAVYDGLPLDVRGEQLSLHDKVIRTQNKLFEKIVELGRAIYENTGEALQQGYAFGLLAAGRGDLAPSYASDEEKKSEAYMIGYMAVLSKAKKPIE